MQNEFKLSGDGVVQVNYGKGDGVATKKSLSLPSKRMSKLLTLSTPAKDASPSNGAWHLAY